MQIVSLGIIVTFAPAVAQQTSLVSENLGGGTPCGGALGPSLSADGALAFASREAVNEWIATEEGQIAASDPGIGDNFGSAVAISGDTAVVGVPSDDLPAGSDAGSAYVFVRSGASWSEQQKLTASSPGFFHLFGSSVAIDGDTIAVGAPNDAGSEKGAIYVFVRSGTTWSEQQRLIASDGKANDSLGSAVAVRGDTIVAGAGGDDHTAPGTDEGSAYVFVRSGTTWSEQAKLVASDAGSEDYFGLAVALAGDTALIGASGDDHVNNSNDNEGSAYVFVRSGTTWGEQQKLTASDAGQYDAFGGSVAVSGDTALVGASNGDRDLMDVGSAYVFARSGTTWSEALQLSTLVLVAGDPLSAPPPFRRGSRRRRVHAGGGGLRRGCRRRRLGRGLSLPAHAAACDLLHRGHLGQLLPSIAFGHGHAERERFQRLRAPG